MKHASHLLHWFLISFCLLGLTVIPSPLQAASGNIIIVTERPELENSGANLGGYLATLGYNVTVDPGAGAGVSAYSTLDAAKITYLESFDLVIVHRSITSGNFDDGSEPTQWNSLNVPLLSGSAYVARTDNTTPKWNWLNGPQARATVTGLTIVNSDHPIFKGLNPDLFNKAVDVDYVNAPNAGNGTLLANVNNAGAAVVIWDNPGFFYGASGQSHTQRRVFFPLMRYHETDASVVPGVFSDYSPNGLKLLKNAVAYAMNGAIDPEGPAIVNLSPADGTVAHPTANGIQFEVTSAEPIPTEGITLTLNAVDVSTQLNIQGDPTARMVSYDSLAPNTAYTGVITASNTLGLTTLSFSFDTYPPDLTAPTIVSVDPAPGSLTDLTQITVTFSEDVKGVAFSDLLINAGPANSVTGSGAVYTFHFDSPAYGTVNISWDPATQITDLAPVANAFNPTGPGTTWQYTLQDLVPPTAATISPFPEATVRNLTQIAVTFSEAVTGVQAGDLLVNNQPAASVSGSFLGPYVFQFPSPATGQVQVAWANGHGITDTANPPNTFAGGSWSYTLNPNFELPDVRINEILGATLSTNQLADEDGDLQDWIEIHNRSASTVNLAGWSLTDDPDDPDRWIFPAVTLAPDEYLVVFASAKDRRSTAPGAKLHTNFQLSSAGEYLALFNAELPPVAVSVLDYPEQRNDISYGYDNTDALRYFATPTPGAPNGASTIVGVVPPVHFNVERGYFDAPFTLYLSTPTVGARIRYTTDGSEPSAGNGQLYEGPLQISQTTVLRAAGFKPDQLPSVTTTHTYLFLDQILSQPNDPEGYPNIWGQASSGFPTADVPADYEMDPEIVTNAVYGPQLLDALKSLPSVSVAMSIDALFGPQNGIYSHVTENQALYRGEAWERPCSVEFIPNNTDNGPEFQVNCGIRMQGNASREPRKLPKHPFRLLFKGAYGPGRLEQPVFPDSAVVSFNTLVMRSDFNNSWLHWDAGQRQRGTRIRDAWAKDTWRAMGQPGSHSRYFHLYLNGLYWGIYDFGERIDASFAANYLGGERENYDAIASKPVKAIDGDTAAYNAMRSAVLQNQSVLANYEAVLQKLDVPNFIDYMLLNFYGANQDWGNDSNWNAVRRRSADGKFKFIEWDGEQLIVNVNDNRVANTDVPGGLHTSLINSPEYRLTFADRVQKHLFNGGALTVQAVTDRWMTRAQEVDLAMIAESARWGDYRRDVHPHSSGPYLFYTHDDLWVPEINRLVTSYFPQRGGIVLNQLRAAGLYPAIDAPSFNQQGGFVPGGSLITMTAANPIYYTTDGSDPRTFGTGAVSANAILYTGPITLVGSRTIKARALNGGTWSALNEASFTVEELSLPLRITEIMYNPIGGDPYEFLEVQNIGDDTLDLSGFSFNGVTFAFPNDSFVPAGQILVLANNVSPAAFASRYPGVDVFGYYQGSLANGGERLAIVDAGGNNITSVTYDDANGWPTEPDGFGPSLEIIDVRGPTSDPSNWRASATSQGSPGALTPPPAPPVVRFNEVMAENLTTISTNGLFSDWIELHNSGASPVNLEGWSLSDGGDPRRFVFPANTTIAAQGYLLIWCDTNVTANGLHTGFGLKQSGENVFLYDPATNRVDAFSFGLQLADFTIGRIGDDWSLCQPTPGTANVAASVASPSDLVLNEWLANAAPGDDDWLELHNPNPDLPVPLLGLYLATSTTTYRITSRSFIAPSGFSRLWADENDGPDHLDFKLPAAGGSITLSSPAGLEIDTITYGAQQESISQGRLPDGSATITSFPGTASPAASNYADIYTGPVLNELMALNGSVVLAPEATYADWIELFNPNGTPFVLSGMRLSDQAGKADRWIVPTGVQIPAQGYLVIWCDGGRPASIVAGPELNTGFSLNGNSGGVYLFNAAGQQVDLVEYGPQVANLSLGLNGEDWALLANPTPGAANASSTALGSITQLRINEWMADAADGDDWFELYNDDDLPVDLSGLYLADNISLTGRYNTRVAPLSFIGAKGFVRWAADGNPSQGRDHVGFSLDGQGESIGLTAADGSLLDSVFLDQQAEGASQGRLPDGQDSQFSFDSSATPAASNYLPLPNAVINEVLTHSDDPLEDAVELHNRSTATVNIGGWYLSDNAADFKKFRIPDGTTLPAGGFKVFYQNQLDGGIGSQVPFTFNSFRGESVILSQADAAGNLTGFRSTFDFGAAANGVSFGRYETIGGPQFPPMAQRTFGVDNPSSLTQFRAGNGLPNSKPRVGPVILNEVMYHPPGLGTDDAQEFIELHNVTGTAVPLFDPAHPENRWRLRGGVSFDFPGDVTLAPRGFLLLVAFDPTTDTATRDAFTALHALPGNVPILGPYQGTLGNHQDRLQLQRPDTPQGPGPDEGFVPYLWVDDLDYSDESPWPAEPDGNGPSLQRRRIDDYGNDPVNWKSLLPTAGHANVAGSGFTDTDADGMPDNYESAQGFNPNDSADGALDFDNDGRTNGQEFLDGTNPKNASSVLKTPAITQQPQGGGTAPGETFVLNVAATGSPTLRYQWRFNGRLLPGANASSLTLASVNKSQTGSYDVVVANDAGFAISRPASLVVNVPPRILMQPVGGFVISPEENVSFSVTAIGTGTLHYQWRLNGDDIPGATGPTLDVTNAQLEDSGEYTVLVSDDLASVLSDPASLSVLVRPSVLVPPQKITAIVGDPVTFSIVARGTLPMSYRWRKGSQTLLLETISSSMSYFTIPSVTLNDAGTYTVVLTNAAFVSPGVLSPTGSLTVLADSDGDRLPDTWETENGFNPNDPADGPLDFDGDGVSNRDEYVAGTNPKDPASYLKVENLSLSTSGALISFQSATGKTYRVEYRDALNGAAWQPLQDVPASGVEEEVQILDKGAKVSAERYYRLTTPKLP